MAEYVPPLRNIRFVLEQLVDLDGLSKLEAYAHADPDTVLGVIEESGQFIAEVVGPLNQIGDTAGSARTTYTNGKMPARSPTAPSDTPMIRWVWAVIGA